MHQKREKGAVKCYLLSTGQPTVTTAGASIRPDLSMNQRTAQSFLLNYWLLMDPWGRAVTVFICVHNGTEEPTKLKLMITQTMLGKIE